MKKIAIICARSGSYRIKNKNLKKLNGKHLIFYTLDAAIKSKIFDQIFINTESKKIIKIIQNNYKNNNLTFYIRPKHLGKSSVFVIDVIKEMLKKLNIEKNFLSFILFPTCPLRNFKDIQNVYQFYKKTKKSIMTVNRYDPPVNLALKIKNRKLTPLFKKDYQKSTRHNDHKVSYYANFAIIVKKVSTLLKQKNLIGTDSIPYFLSYESSLDIDENYQLDLARKLLKLNNYA